LASATCYAAGQRVKIISNSCFKGEFGKILDNFGGGLVKVLIPKQNAAVIYDTKEIEAA